MDCDSIIRGFNPRRSPFLRSCFKNNRGLVSGRVAKVPFREPTQCDCFSLQQSLRPTQYNSFVISKKKCALYLCRAHFFLLVSERVGFEPTVTHITLVFKTKTINHSDTSPWQFAAITENSLFGPSWI
jgi:hypothetical protein